MCRHRKLNDAPFWVGHSGLNNLSYEAIMMYNLSGRNMDEIDTAVQKMLQAEVRNGKQSACVSDTLEGLIGKDLQFVKSDGNIASAGHDELYWLGNGGKSVTVPDEFFQNIARVVLVIWSLWLL